MKKIITYLLVMLVISALLQSCKKDDCSAAAYPSGQGIFTATGGLTLNLTGTSSSFIRRTTSTYDSIYVGGGTYTPQTLVGLYFVNIKTAGTYALNLTGSQSAAAGYFTGTNTSTDYYLSTASATPGSVTITVISSTAIEGTYTTTVKNYAGTSITFSGTFQGNF